MKQYLTLLLLVVLLISACSSSEALTPTSDTKDTPVVVGPSSIPPAASSTPTSTPLPEEKIITVENTRDGAGESSDITFETLANICGGASRVSQAAAYNPFAISPLIMIASGGKNDLDLSSELPASWVPIKIELTELVVCIGFEEEILFQTCKYDNGPDVKRYRHKYNVTVYEAMTGEILAEGIFLGAKPRICREIEEYELERLDGGIDFDPIIGWLCQFVDPTCDPQAVPTIMFGEATEYTVKEGDTCESIAAEFGVSVESIININNLSASCELFVGAELLIP